jgi:hypothetical protein
MFRTKCVYFKTGNILWGTLKTEVNIRFHKQGYYDRLRGLLVRVLGYRIGGPGSIPGTTRFSDKKKKKENK